MVKVALDHAAYTAEVKRMVAIEKEIVQRLGLKV
jgi:hypothetical protein